MQRTPPVVLVFAGSDPTSGAGTTADALTLSSFGCHPACVVTAVTAQDTVGIKQFEPVEAELVIAQARAILEDMKVAAFKIGMLATNEIASVVASILKDYPGIPVVLDPVQASGHGDALAIDLLNDAIKTLLLPHTTLATPNTLEARALSPGADNLNACAHELLSYGTDYVLLTGTHEPTPTVTHRLYGNARELRTFEFERLPHDYHGSGCTLAAACAATLAHGLPIEAAVDEALTYTFEALKFGYRVGCGQWVPDRLYWANEDNE
jgi:hydroxymethylpyrimidine/phosphomethylpyrimidine kinase